PDQGKTSPDKGKTKKGPQLKDFIFQQQFVNGHKVQKISPQGDPTLIFPKLLKPYKITKPSSETFASDISTFLTTYVYQGSEYQFWKKNETTGTYIFVQSYAKHPVIANSTFQRGALELFVSSGNITEYKQTYLKITPIHNKSDKEAIISPIKAIYYLFNDNDISVGGTVEEIELSYYNGLESNRDTKIFAPAWHVKVKEGDGKPAKWYFVNAVNGAIQVPNQQEENTG
ncbi:MAG TPA: two-component system regulatory protein YycI, partial [Bacillales bacterium]|nr:two-component system regulatory protein YycI [Bacillales bacterium]